jgi:hypothetical protein
MEKAPRVQVQHRGDRRLIRVHDDLQKTFKGGGYGMKRRDAISRQHVPFGYKPPQWGLCFGEGPDNRAMRKMLATLPRNE